jgi:hypothetical protein
MESRQHGSINARLNQHYLSFRDLPNLESIACYIHRWLTARISGKVVYGPAEPLQAQRGRRWLIQFCAVSRSAKAGWATPPSGPKPASRNHCPGAISFRSERRTSTATSRWCSSNTSTPSSSGRRSGSEWIERRLSVSQHGLRLGRERIVRRTPWGAKALYDIDSRNYGSVAGFRSGLSKPILFH